jgi:hypothetical protein
MGKLEVKGAKWRGAFYFTLKKNENFNHKWFKAILIFVRKGRLSFIVPLSYLNINPSCSVISTQQHNAWGNLGDQNFRKLKMVFLSKQSFGPGCCWVGFIFVVNHRQTACEKLVNVTDFNLIIINSFFLKLTMFTSSHKLWHCVNFDRTQSYETSQIQGHTCGQRWTKNCLSVTDLLVLLQTKFISADPWVEIRSDKVSLLSKEWFALSKSVRLLGDEASEV